MRVSPRALVGCVPQAVQAAVVEYVLPAGPVVVEAFVVRAEPAAAAESVLRAEPAAAAESVLQYVLRVVPAAAVEFVPQGDFQHELLAAMAQAAAEQRVPERVHSQRAGYYSRLGHSVAYHGSAVEQSAFVRGNCRHSLLLHCQESPRVDSVVHHERALD